MINFWAWGGKYIGFSEGRYLYFKDGDPIGYINGKEVFDFNGKYLCDIMDGRLIVDQRKCIVRCAMAKPCRMCGRSYVNYVGYVMLAGYQDFVWDEQS